MAKYTLAQVLIDRAADLLIDQISDQRISPGIQRLIVGGSGVVDPTFAAIGSQNPTISFTTSALSTVLGSIGIDGLKIDTEDATVTAKFWLQNLAEGAARGGDGTNHLLTVNKGLLVPRTISAPHNGAPASLTMEMIITYDGTLDPIEISTGQDLGGSPSVGEVFTAGKVMLNGAELAGVQNIDIDFGIDARAIGGSGGVWPTFVAIFGREPSIRILSTEADIFNTLGLIGDEQGDVDSLIYLRKVEEGATRIADNVAEHISFSVDKGLVTVEEVAGGHNEIQMAEVVITPTYDGTAPILVINPATTIA